MLSPIASSFERLAPTCPVIASADFRESESRRIGGGDQGDVYLCTLTSGTQVVVKQPRLDADCNVDDAIRLFCHEATVQVSVCFGAVCGARVCVAAG